MGDGECKELSGADSKKCSGSQTRTVDIADWTPNGLEENIILFHSLNSSFHRAGLLQNPEMYRKYTRQENVRVARLHFLGQSHRIEDWICLGHVLGLSSCSLLPRLGGGQLSSEMSSEQFGTVTNRRGIRYHHGGVATECVQAQLVFYSRNNEFRNDANQVHPLSCTALLALLLQSQAPPTPAYWLEVSSLARGRKNQTK
mmetsp:Transcript_8585/g.17390  ORF Transcript_8585/g.17390 Transcript_8585/m.17390 type:complete len:200 (-) Transcript_8585:1586-2185(-)